MRPAAIRLPAVLCASLLAASPLAAQTPAPVAGPMALLKPSDQARIRNLAASRDKALEQAAGAKAAELRVVREFLALPAQPLDLPKLPGSWRCRTIDLGGMDQLTINAFFACRIVREGDKLVLQKTTGSLRRNARLVPLDDKRLLMFGAYWSPGDKPQPYDTDDYRDEAGVLEQVGSDRLRLELPEPRAFDTAKHAIIELIRQK